MKNSLIKKVMIPVLIFLTGLIIYLYQVNAETTNPGKKEVTKKTSGNNSQKTDGNKQGKKKAPRQIVQKKSGITRRTSNKPNETTINKRDDETKKKTTYGPRTSRTLNNQTKREVPIAKTDDVLSNMDLENLKKTSTTDNKNLYTGTADLKSTSITHVPFTLDRNMTSWFASVYYCGNGKKWKDLEDLNKDKLVKLNGEEQFPKGCTIKIPREIISSNKTTSVASNNTAKEKEENTYFTSNKTDPLQHDIKKEDLKKKSSIVRTTVYTSKTYTIKENDILWEVSRKHYGSGVYYKNILEANPGLDPDKLPVDKKITLPVIEGKGPKQIPMG